ncbi:MULTISPECIES: hypothetical protein [Methylomonas]|nr:MULTISPECIES: hypothetical protein [Methylomonas]
MDTIDGITIITATITGHILECIVRREWDITLPRRRAISHGRRWIITATRRGPCPDMTTGIAGDQAIANRRN